MENTTLPPQTTEASNEQTLHLQQSAKKRVVLVVLIIIILLLGGIAFVMVPRQSSPTLTVMAPTLTNTPLPTQTVTAAPGWLTYENSETGFSFAYPSTIGFNDEPQDANNINLTVNVEKLADIPDELPMNAGRLDALKDKERLAYGVGADVVNVGALRGAVSTTFVQFEVCSVMFVRTLTFYPGEYRVRLSLYGPKAQIMEEMPEYFKTDELNCGAEKVWELDQIPAFELKLQNGEGMGVAQQWYTLFDSIVKTIVTTASPTASTK
ncbi:hypothetical protein KBB12_00450 [Candidatus Woesebacteria bacterium]|nr:hypothetical protein [Candidatus Woesebacteria bacterium]